MTCPFLEYRAEGDGHEFDVARAYCSAAEQFVQPMRADICNDRYDLDHETDCEIYREHADELGDDERGDESDEGRKRDAGRSAQQDADGSDGA